MGTRAPMGVGDIVLAGFKIFSDRWRALLKLTAIVVLPVTVFGLLVVATFAPETLLDILGSGNTMTPDEMETALQALTADDITTFAVVFGAFVIVTGVANTIAFGGCVVIALDHISGQARTHQEALRAALSRALSLLWIVLLTLLLASLGLVLCILPGVWLFVSWAVAPAALFDEGIKGRKALGRSFRLVRPRFWPTFLVIALEFLALFLLQTSATTLPALFLPESVEQNAFAAFFTANLASAAVGIVGVALHAGIMTELFLDLRLRAEQPPGVANGQPPVAAPPAPPPLPPSP